MKARQKFVDSESSQGNLTDEGLRRKIEANLFPFARPAVEPWKTFRWHRGFDTWQVNSSQALAIDVFGTLKLVRQEDRDSILNYVARNLGIAEGENWQVKLEWIDDKNRLGETGFKTQVDALAYNDRTAILFEGKFGESDGGSCSQTGTIKKGKNQGVKQCNGNYSVQTNPVNNKANRCVLTGKGIQYWTLVPSVFKYDSSVDFTPCPFKGPWYQWMRNLTLAGALTGELDEPSKPPEKNPRMAFVVAYADAQGLPFPAHLNTEDWRTFLRSLRTDRVAFATRSYQWLIKVARTILTPASDQTDQTSKARIDVWLKLDHWVREKIQKTTA